jgi:hypothetical protein
MCRARVMKPAAGQTRLVAKFHHIVPFSFSPFFFCERESSENPNLSRLNFVL